MPGATILFDGSVPPDGGTMTQEPQPTTYDLYEQGRARLENGNAAGAAELLELAVEQEPEKASLHEALGRAYFATAHLTWAREQFERALELHPTDDFAHFVIGRCFERQGRLAEAAKYYKLACALAPREDYTTALARVRDRTG
ncbi:MAG: tetratricopeptide repeat protein [Nitriliruptorales bacterium]|nr:tetratricopeptide repeat protein [Nitriliruptorales bacterium]